MSLIGVFGEFANRIVLQKACNKTPSLVIDCANKTDPHRLLPNSSAEALHNVHAIHIDLLYSYRDVLVLIPKYVKLLNIKQVIVTSTDHLFNYQDVDENWDVRVHAWILLKKISSFVPVLFAIKPGSSDYVLAKKFCDKIIGGDSMGHTVRSQRQVVDELISELKAFSTALSNEDKAVFLDLVQKPLKHLGSISNASSLHTWAFFVLSVCLEQEKRMRTGQLRA